MPTRQSFPLPCLKVACPLQPLKRTPRLSSLVKEDQNGATHHCGHRNKPRGFPLWRMKTWTALRSKTDVALDVAGDPTPLQALDHVHVPMFGAMWQPFPPKYWGRGPELLYKGQHPYLREGPIPTRSWIPRVSTHTQRKSSTSSPLYCNSPSRSRVLHR